MYFKKLETAYHEENEPAQSMLRRRVISPDVLILHESINY
jgi:hypothetical protein